VRRQQDEHQGSEEVVGCEEVEEHVAITFSKAPIDLGVVLRVKRSHQNSIKNVGRGQRQKDLKKGHLRKKKDRKRGIYL